MKECEVVVMRLAFTMFSTALILFFSGPSWAQPDENAWLMSTRGRSEHRLRPPASSAAVLELLQIQYPHVKNPHRVRPMTSRRQGYRKDIDAFLASARAEGKTLFIQEFRVVHSNPKGIVTLLPTLVPGVTCRVEGQSLFVLGEPGALDQVAALQPELDFPHNVILLKIHLVEFAPKGFQRLGLDWNAPSSATETVIESVNGKKLESRVNTTILQAGYR